MKSIIALTTIFSLSGCIYSTGTNPVEIPVDLTCHSQVMPNNDINLLQRETIVKWTGNNILDHFRVTRITKTEDTVGASEFSTTVTEQIKLYDHDRWNCESDDGQKYDYKTMQPT